MNSNYKGNVLIVDDEPNAIKVLSAILKNEDYNVFEAQNITNAYEILHQKNVEAIITDLRMPGKDGMHLFEYVTEKFPAIPVIFLTAFGTVESAVSTILNGAFYYFIKPPDYLKLKGMLSRAIEQHRLKKELKFLKERLAIDSDTRVRMCGNTPEMLRIFQTIETIKDSESSVLICGETGTGKELLAKALHFSSKRKDKPFIAVNCAAIPRELLESELFGYERGAFTGAHSRRIGRFEEASGGTIFLDEIGELELSLQSKLLRVLEEREVERLGSNKKNKVEFRLLSSTNRDLKKEVSTGNFREDLFYRINVVQITVPPLRERKDDIPLLVSRFIKEFCIREKKMLEVSDDVMKIFMSYHWPGNIRQLRNVIERAVVLAKKGWITLRDLPEEFSSLRKQKNDPNSLKTLRELEIQAIRNAIYESKGNKSKAAKTLGISRKALYKRVKEFQLL